MKFNRKRIGMVHTSYALATGNRFRDRNEKYSYAIRHKVNEWEHLISANHCHQLIMKKEKNKIK